VHLARREAFWKGTDQGEGQGLRRLRFDRSRDAFDKSACDALAALCVAKSRFGVWFPALKGGDRGHMNLLEVVLPETMFVSASPFKTGRQALFELLDKEDRPPDDWVIRAGRFMSFQDPRNTVIEKIVDGGSVEEVPATDVALPDEEPEEHAVIDLLRRTLGAQLDGLLAFSRERKAFYFRPSRRRSSGLIRTHL
jgi:hypothetical protein